MIKYDIEIDWMINEFCNFNCAYCFYTKNKRKLFIGLKNTKKVIDAFNRSGLVWLINISGGEPFFFPNFLKFCKEITQKHFISINTNLSHRDVYAFAENISPERVAFIHCSLHIEERERLNLVKDFIDKYIFLKDRKFYVFASYVMYPHLIDRFKNDYRYFKNHGIILRPKLFRGVCSRFKIIDAPIFRKIKPFFGPWYPNSYSEKQKTVIKYFINKSEIEGNFDELRVQGRMEVLRADLSLDKYFLGGLPSFKGRLCLAGKTFVSMRPNGDFYRCLDEPTHLGNLYQGGIKLFEKPTPCRAIRCTCFYIGSKYIVNDANA